MCTSSKCAVCCFKKSLPTRQGASQVALVVKNLPANSGDVGDLGLILGWEDPLEEGMATHCSFLAWRIPWTREPGGLQSIGSQRVRHDWRALTQHPTTWRPDLVTNSQRLYMNLPAIGISLRPMLFCGRRFKSKILLFEMGFSVWFKGLMLLCGEAVQELQAAWPGKLNEL